MSKISELFGFTTGFVQNKTELPEIFPLSLTEQNFIESDLLALYQKILTDTLERTQGINPDQSQLLFDNFVQGESGKGLISLLAWGMYRKNELFLVYNSSLNILRPATDSETQEIRKDYSERGESAGGVYISFKEFRKTDILKTYSALEYCLISGLYKSVNLSKAIQIKANELRGSIGATDAKLAIDQAIQIAESLGKGKDVLLDGKDTIEMIKPDLDAVEKGMDFLNEKRSFYLGLPKSYISGDLATGIGSTGVSDTKAIDRGLRIFYFSVVKPVVEKVFQVETVFKTQDLSQMPQALEVLKTFEITGEEFLSKEDKENIVQKVFDIGDQF